MNLTEFLQITDEDTYVCIACADGGGWMVIGPPSRIDLDALDEDKQKYTQTLLEKTKIDYTREVKRMSHITEMKKKYPGWTEDEVLMWVYYHGVKRDDGIDKCDSFIKANRTPSLKSTLEKIKAREQALIDTDLSPLGEREVVETYPKLCPENGHRAVAVKVTGRYHGEYWYYEEQEGDRWKYLKRR